MTVDDFDRLYRADNDPWRVATSWYEQRKIGIVLASLSQRRYQRALDPACGTGHLARELASRCTEVFASDASAVAVDIARGVCADVSHLTIRHRALPEVGGSGEGEADLIVLSEVLYYLPVDMRRQAISSVLRQAAPRVEVVAVHWTEQPEEALVSGEHVHTELRELFGTVEFRHQVAHFDEEFTLDIFTRGHDHYLP